jgi:hypothetical protein
MARDKEMFGVHFSSGARQISLSTLWAINLTIQHPKYVDVSNKTHPSTAQP